MQGSIFPYKQFFPWEFCNPFFLEISCWMIVLFLDAYFQLDGLIIFSIGGKPTQRHGHIFNVICIGRIKIRIRKLRRRRWKSKTIR
jgi:hypothetical protein